ncbi:RNA polymerase sigma-70 factor, ECF subfamily [Zhouia amylolytica]|uniref:RNA polymerase sigma factor n=2 Tax=Zhouia amylolytica TaxID=376730 RepID=W2URU1_9FLAO|nr:RNA polymerase sigma factor [Zhouia amylolytica]ETN96037.1 RNA polymerase sigma factor, sigma-70 family [Zhouia amylolytica AD3]MCQ0111324.1 RNA polymerase sigma factor [Zhouia amylolytica]SFS50442.1 RNA polymerase sigma-70 factor, ECF subfamily [Zhouia amylolytica]
MFQIDLVEKCKKNDRKAQMQLYKQYCDAMFCVSMRYLKNVDDAQDVTQEAFIRAFQKIDQFKAEVTFGAWLKKIVVNKCIDFLKRKHQYYLALDENILNVVDENDWKVDDQVSIEEVKSAIENLPEKYKYVVMLYLIEGYDHAEISEILDITQTASRTQLLRGKNQLRELLKDKRYGTRS